MNLCVPFDILRFAAVPLNQSLAPETLPTYRSLSISGVPPTSVVGNSATMAPSRKSLYVSSA